MKPTTSSQPVHKWMNVAGAFQSPEMPPGVQLLRRQHGPPIRQQDEGVERLHAEIGSVGTNQSTRRATPFPRRLLGMIRSEAVKHPEVVRWSKDGHAFFIDDEIFFIVSILPRYGFKASKMQSFQRNLNIYGFTRLTKGQYASGYFHKMFERDIGDKELDEVIRVSNKGKQSEPSPHSATFNKKKRRHIEEPCLYEAQSKISGGGTSPSASLSNKASYFGSPAIKGAEHRPHHLSPRMAGKRMHEEKAIESIMASKRIVGMMSPGTFWALPHASNTSITITSTVMAPQPIDDGTMDVMYIERYKPRRMQAAASFARKVSFV